MSRIWDVKACRSCLTVKGKLEKIGDASKRQYTAITGLQIADGDGYPVYFCVECRHHIRKSLAFRRKSRRAHFVLKEILNVRKQVSYSDIVTVNRKKTNLESSLNFWEPHHNPCYLIANEDGQEDDSLQKYNLDAPQYTRCHSKPIIDIKPEIDTEIPEETNEPEDDATTNDVEDIPTNDYLEPELDTANIDMNDIFKDLETEPDVLSDDNDNFEEPPIPEPKKEVDNLKLAKPFVDGTVAKAMLIFDLKVLNLEEQKQKMELRKSLHPFSRALYKCAMCMTIHKTMNELVKHVHYHNKRKFQHECKVCKNNFPTVEELNVHVANCHMYEYSCKICRAKVYTQKDAVIHHKSRHATETQQLVKSMELKKELRQTLANFTITALSQQMMSDVMLLRSRPEHSRGKLEPGEAKPGEKCNFACDICSTGFKFRKSLYKHMVLKHRYMYTCKLCKEVFTTRAQAIEHNDEVHAIKHPCEECGKTFKNSIKLQTHVKAKHTKYIPCNMCGNAFRSEKIYYTHQLREHEYISINDPLLGDPNHKCSECNVQFRDRRSLERHLVTMNHAGADMVQFACIPCKKLYETEEELETHFIICREARKYPRKCCYCSEMLHNVIHYKTHYMQEHPTLQYRYLTQNSICDICGKSIFKPFLEAHRRTHFAAATGLPCRLCVKRHATPAQHLAHMLAQHARRPFRCALCTRRFKYRSDCKDHVLKVHEPTKLFKCEFCGVEFSYWRNLKEHSETVHNLVIPPIKTKVAKSKDTMFVYAHMKIIINELERDIVEKVKIELMDYLEQKSKPVEYENYFIFSPDAEETTMVKNRSRDLRKRDRRKKKPTELEAAVAQISYPESGIKIEKIEIIKPGEVEKIEDVPDVDENVSSVKEEEDTVEMEVDKVEVDDSEPLEVIENDGHQFVMINGEMYRIACEDEV
ncbi:zinc finger and BTB domain-containing protein 41-like isoform X2 [Cydia splendana]|uniref:zinc finger and BTB domain-containing protein 41-like isoform X2 n=1 Tax=Cydia splendana TaxID=1100963 RepID=UPI00300CF6FF